MCTVIIACKQRGRKDLWWLGIMCKTNISKHVYMYGMPGVWTWACVCVYVFTISIYVLPCMRMCLRGIPTCACFNIVIYVFVSAQY